MGRTLIGLVLSALSCAAVSDLDYLQGFDDSIMYKIVWSGGLMVRDMHKLAHGEMIDVTTHNNEKYSCNVPSIQEKEKDSEDVYVGPNPVQLVAPMFAHSTCMTIIEPYWTYELCHGRYIRQYHEDREGKKLKLQEYVLGKWDGAKTSALSAELERLKAEGASLNPPIKKLDGINLPYLQLNYTDGTICDLNGKPRRTSVLYVCFMGGKNEIFIIKESSSCEYEAIATSAELCKHPKYRPKLTGENEIYCLAGDGAPDKPASVTAMETEAAKQRQFSSFTDSKSDKMFAVYSVGEINEKDGKMQFRVELRPLEGEEGENELPDQSSAHPVVAPPPPAKSPLTSPLSSDADINFKVFEFLLGRACPEGSYGWWTYRFCYNNKVEQYHFDRETGALDSIVLGVWDKAAHIDWLSKRPHKRPRPGQSRTHLSYFYGRGDVCPNNGKVRETEVKLKCTKGKEETSLYFLELNICQYIIGVESALICEFINQVDEFGLYQP